MTKKLTTYEKHLLEKNINFEIEKENLDHNPSQAKIDVPEILDYE